MRQADMLLKSDDVISDYVASDADLTPNMTPTRIQQRLSEKMHILVKGANYRITSKSSQVNQTPGANQPLDDDAAFPRGMKAEKAFKAAVRQGLRDPGAVYKSMNPQFASQFGAFLANNPASQQMNQWVAGLQSQINDVFASLGSTKSITLNSPNATGLVPYNLVAPTRLIYPVYTPVRNKLPRTQGQGIAYQEKVITGISGSQTGSSGGRVIDIGIPEIAGGTNLNNWPLNLPPSGTQDSVNISVPYKFSGLSENVSWLAQFAGQGFEDASALANLLLLQEFMLGEEYAFTGGTSTALATPTAPICTARSANSGETALSGTITNNTVDVKVTAANWWGETAPSLVTAVTGVTSGSSVVDVQVVPVPGALWYNIYVTVGTSAGTYFLMAGQSGGVNGTFSGPVGGLLFTLQGAVPTAGVGIPTADTGTYSNLRQEGLIPVLAGHSQGGSNIYPSGWQGGYINQSAGTVLNTAILNTAFNGVYNNSGAFKADPAEIIANGIDVSNLSNDIVQQASATNFRLMVMQQETPGVQTGVAVSEFVNSITRSVVRIAVDPWMPQGTVLGMTYTLPYGWSNVDNAWEVNLVQDYLSISWPVIDASFRYSMYTYGNVVANAPQYSLVLQGLQKTDRSGSTGTWS